MADPKIASDVSPFAHIGTALAGIWYYVKKIANSGLSAVVSGPVEITNDVGNPISVQGPVAEGQGASFNPVRQGWMAQDPSITLPPENSGDIVTPLTDLNKRSLNRQSDLISTNDSAAVIGQVLATDNAMSTFRTTALTNVAQSIKASGGNAYSFYAFNVNVTPVYLKFYNTASGSVVVGTTAVIDTIVVPAGDGTTPGVASGSLVDPLYPVQFATAISVAGVTGSADSDATAPTTSIYLKVWYK